MNRNIQLLNIKELNTDSNFVQTTIILITSNFLLLILLTMRRASNADSKGSQKKYKKPVTNKQKAQFFAKKLQDSIALEIEKGKIVINGIKQNIKYQQKQSNLGQMYSALSLDSIAQNLKQLRSSIQLQKKEHQEVQKAKLLIAKELVAKMKKEKQQHKQKIRQTQDKRSLHSRIYSQSTITKMKQHLQERILDKKRQLEERIKNISLRKDQRGQKTVGQQVQYWENIKKIQQKSKSSIKLPSLLNPQQEQSKSHKIYIPRKNSNDNLRKIHPERQKYQHKIDHFLEISRIKQSSLKLKLSQQKGIDKFHTIINNHNSFSKELVFNNSQKYSNPYQENKYKLYGNEYLKESLLKVKKSGPTIQLDTEILGSQDSIQVQAQQVSISNNQQLQKLQQIWCRVLSRIEHNQIGQEQGIQLLNSMQKRLDKINLQGIRKRLKKKCEVFEKIQLGKKGDYISHSIDMIKI